MVKLNLDDVKEAADFERIKPGGYICKIVNVDDVSEKEYLLIEYDIAQGEFTGYFQTIFEKSKWWVGRFIRSYKETALPFFKSFVVAVENSNPRYRFNYNEKSLEGKKVGIIIGEEEYLNKDNEIKVRICVANVCSVNTISDGDFKIPALKKLKTAVPVTPMVCDDDEVPF